MVQIYKFGVGACGIRMAAGGQKMNGRERTPLLGAHLEGCVTSNPAQ